MSDLVLAALSLVGLIAYAAIAVAIFEKWAGTVRAAAEGQKAAS